MHYKKMILPIFLQRSISRASFGIFFILVLIVFGNQFFLVISQSLNEGYYSSEIFPLMILKLVRDLPFIVGLAFILAITYSINRLYKTSQAVILLSSGISDLKIFKLILPTIISITILISLFSLYFVPLVKEKIELIKLNASERPEYIFMKEGIFQNFQNGENTFYVEEISTIQDSDNQKLKNIFLYSKINDKLILANTG